MMKAVKRPIVMQLLELNIIVEKTFGPIIIPAARPPNCRPINPKRLPKSTPEYFSIESFFILQAIREAPPKMAVVKPRHVGTIDGLTALAKPMRGAPVRPSPTTPIPNIACLSMLLMGFTVSIFSLLLSFSTSTVYLGCIQLEEIKPMNMAIAPPKEICIIIALRAGIESTAYALARAPPKARPVVVYTCVRNLLMPTFLEITWLVASV